MSLLALTFSLLGAMNGLQAPAELDAIPAGVRGQATLIFVGQYVTRRGPMALRADGMIAHELLGGFVVTTPILGAAPPYVAVDLTRMPHSDLVDNDLTRGKYLVLLRPGAASWSHLGDEKTIGDDEILAVVRIRPLAERIEIVEYGRFQRAGEEQKLNAPDTASGYVNVVDAMSTPAVVERTDCIEGVSGRTFGFLFLAERSAESGAEEDEDDDGIAQLRVRVLHPAMHNPKTNLTTEREEWNTSANLGIVRFTGWTFDEAWEIVPGTWAIEVLQRGKVMARKEFVVTPAEPRATPPSPPSARPPATEDLPRPPASSDATPSPASRPSQVPAP